VGDRKNVAVGCQIQDGYGKEDDEFFHIGFSFLRLNVLKMVDFCLAQHPEFAGLHIANFDGADPHADQFQNDKVRERSHFSNLLVASLRKREGNFMGVVFSDL